jgi:hypothetical protein
MLLRNHSSERNDLKTLLIAAITIPLTWLLALEWHPNFSIMGQDAWAMTAPFLDDLLKHKGDWTQLLYRPGIEGGAKLHEIAGTIPLHQLCGWLGLSLTFTLNLTVFFAQICYAFLGTRAILDLTSIPENKSWLLRIALVLVLAFAPFLGWKIFFGHYIMILGNFVFLSLLALILAIRNQTLSLTLITVCFLAMINCFPSTGQQALLYSAVFGGPILLGAAWPTPKSRYKYFALPLLLVIAAFAVSLPKFLPMLAHAQSSDAGRALGSFSIIYSIITATLNDWLTSIPWTLDLFSEHRRQFLLHETNYPFGWWLALLFFFPWRKNKALALGLSVSLLSAIMFSMNIKPVTTLLTGLIPALHNFRVPERAILPFMFTLPIIGAAGVITVITKYARKHTSIAIAITLLILGAASIAAFKERTTPYSNIESLLSEAKKIGNSIISQAPELESPLTRARLNFVITEFDSNTAWALGISSLDAYWFPLKRFSQLAMALDKQPFHPAMVNFHFPPDTVVFEVLRQLYNVKYIATNTDNNAVTIQKTGPTAGPAWFSEKLIRTESVERLTEILTKKVGTIHRSAKQQVLIVEADPEIRNKPLPERFSPECKNSKVLSVRAEHESQLIEVKVQSTAPLCPLTIAMNFSQTLKATTGTSRLTIFPAYGALTGIIVPGGTEIISLRPELSRTP